MTIKIFVYLMQTHVIDISLENHRLHGRKFGLQTGRDAMCADDQGINPVQVGRRNLDRLKLADFQKRMQKLIDMCRIDQT